MQKGAQTDGRSEPNTGHVKSSPDRIPGSDSEPAQKRGSGLFRDPAQILIDVELCVAPGSEPNGTDGAEGGVGRRRAAALLIDIRHHTSG